jgi:hypothetical protein
MRQRTVILNLIERFGLKIARPVGTPVADVIFSAEDMNFKSDQDTLGYSICRAPNDTPDPCSVYVRFQDG